MSARHFPITLLLAAACVRGLSLHAEPADDKLLLHWTFDQESGSPATDSSANQLHGKLTAARVESPAGMAVSMDGTPNSIVSVQVPEEKRFGRDSWTFMAMLKPREFAIDSKQNQRRIFSFGAYPDANLVIDINGSGHPTCYFCYRGADGRTISTGATAETALPKDAWAHLAVVCDRENAATTIHINGFPAGGGAVPAGFDGNFVLGGALTVGCGWQNYSGLMDDVRIHRRALPPAAIEAEFKRLKPLFQIVESPAILAAKQRIHLEKSFAAANDAWTRRHFEELRKLCRQVLETADAPAHFRSYAQLRIAGSFLAEGNRQAARAEYEAIASMADYPAVHRDEARDSILALDRLQQGLPAADPAASRTPLPGTPAFAAEIFVAPAGNDSNPGTSDLPFASLERARNEVRTMKKSGTTGPVAVTLLPGVYQSEKTLALTAEDSGTPSSPVVYRASARGAAVLRGGRTITGFQPVTDPAVLQRLPEDARGKVWQCDLKALGINDYGELKVRGFGQPASPPTLELFFDRRPMTLARWPNEGFVGIGKLLKPGSLATGEPSVFEYLSDRHARWTGATDAWLFGYFHFLWADATIKVGTIDPKAKTLTTAQPYHYGGNGMDTAQGIQYHAFNLLEEIDAPGEWYLARNSGILYFHPPSDPGRSTIEIGTLDVPMVTMENLSHVRIEGIVFDLARHDGIVMKNCSNCLIAGCTVTRMAGNGVMIHGGAGNHLLGCDIHAIGRRATEVIGGDRATLTPARHLVENCQIHDFGRIDRTYTPAIQLEGVGTRIAHNLIYNGPSSAMRIEGNDHLIEFNEVHSMVRESDDQGALELFGNPSYRGVVFRHNYLHDIGKTGSEAAVHGQAAIRFDDAISDMLVHGNVFLRCANGNFGAIQINSGRDNLIDNNLFIDCKQGVSGGWNRGNHVWNLLREGGKQAAIYQNDLYLARYPKIATMLDEPAVNHLWRNVFHRCGRGATRVSNLDLFQNAEFEDLDPGFENAVVADFRLRPDAVLFQTLGFKPIPCGEIGLYQSPARATWPVHHTPIAMPDWRENH